MAQPERDVLGDAEMSEERALLEDEPDVAVFRGDFRDIALADAHAPVVGWFEPGDEAQERGLAAAAGANEGENLAVVQRHVDVVDHRSAIERPRQSGDIQRDC